MLQRLALVLGSCFPLALVGCSGESSTTIGSTSTGASSSSGGSTESSSSGSASSGSGSVSSSSSSSSGGTGGSGGGGNAKSVVKFVAIGDTGKGNQGQYDVAAAMAKKCEADGCDFVQLLGDNIYDSGVDSTSDPQWQSKFELPYAALDLPFWVVLGNHDYGGDGAGTDFGKGKHEIDYTKISTKWKLPAAYYTRSEKHVDFFALDTNMAMFSQADNQKNDVPTWIAASKAQWKIALGHHPYLSNGKHGNAGEYEGLPFVPIVNGKGVKDLLDDVVCGKVDLYLCGHDHSMQWLQPKCGSNTELVISGAGASTSELKGGNPVHFESLDIGFFYVVIEDNVLTGQFYNAAGEVLFTRTITK
ncbi:MAG: metallophosphoesterase [Polyangiaceae bacterium]|nr:metallophosphoesterase [Polyangiaceae bacterium]